MRPISPHELLERKKKELVRTEIITEEQNKQLAGVGFGVCGAGIEKTGPLLQSQATPRANNAAFHLQRRFLATEERHQSVSVPRNTLLARRGVLLFAGHNDAG